MNYSHENTHDSLATKLFQPKMLLALILLWFAIVIIGSGIAISTTNSALLSDAEVENMLSENERLAQATNVAYAGGSEVRNAEIAAANVAPVFPERLTIPTLGIDLPIANPNTRNIEALDEELKSAVVRYPDAATLGQQGGNVLIFGHSSHLPIVRNKFFKAFNDIEKLTEGEIITATSGNENYTYRVTRVYQASAASDDRIALSVPGHRLTLLTCDSFGKKSDRWVVEAEFVGKAS